MTYLEETLGDRETVIHKAAFHWTYTFGAALVLILGAISAIILWLMLVFAAPGWEWAAYVLLALFAIQFLRMMITKWTTEIAVTNQRFLYKRGWISRRTHELPIHRVEEVNVDQSVLGRVFGFGRIRVSGTGGDKPITIPNIDDPLDFRKALLELLEGMAQASSTTR